MVVFLSYNLPDHPHLDAVAERSITSELKKMNLYRDTVTRDLDDMKLK